MKRPLIEACVDSYASAMAASRAGADRLELCAHLVIGGTTPTHALFRQVQRDSGGQDQCPDPPALRRFSLQQGGAGADVRGDPDCTATSARTAS